MSLGHVMSLMVSLMGTAPLPWARAITQASHSAVEQRRLIVIGFIENGYARGVPFGITCCYRRGMTLVQAARRALVSYHLGLRTCHGDPIQAYGLFNTGHCVVNQYAERAWRYQQRIQGLSTRRRTLP